MRIDKWLWAIRLFKHRNGATTAAKQGHIRIDGVVVKASKRVTGGEMVAAFTPGGARVVEVLVVSDVRGPASVAVTLYTDHTPPEPEKGAVSDLGARDRGTGRPTKREGRLLRQFKTRG